MPPAFLTCILIRLYLIARYCQSDVPLRRQFRRINRLRILVERGARFGMAKQTLNCLYGFALVDKEGREAMTEVVKAESLPRFQPDANLNRGGANFVCGHHAGTQRCSALHLCGGENPVVRLCIESIPMPTSEGIGQYVSERDRSG